MAPITDPVSSARALRTKIRELRHETEANRRLPSSIVDGLIEGGLCRLTVPNSLGGGEAEPLVGLEVGSDSNRHTRSFKKTAGNAGIGGMFVKIVLRVGPGCVLRFSRFSFHGSRA